MPSKYNDLVKKLFDEAERVIEITTQLPNWVLRNPCANPVSYVVMDLPKDVEPNNCELLDSRDEPTHMRRKTHYLVTIESNLALITISSSLGQDTDEAVVKFMRDDQDSYEFIKSALELIDGLCKEK